MERDRTSSAVPIVALLGVLLVGALAAFFLLGRQAARGTLESAERARVEQERAHERVELAEAAAARTRAVQGEAEAVTDAVTVPVDATTDEVDAADGVPVRLVVAENRWLARDIYATLAWTDPEGATRRLECEDRDGEDLVVLPLEPRSADEFTQVSLSGLAGRVLELAPLGVDRKGAGAARFELRVALEDGARLVWADHVAFEERTPVEVSFGGWTAPPTREVYSFGRRYGLVDRLTDVELPLTLPRPASDDVVWVGAPRHIWRRFAVDPSTERVEVVLAPAATIRVLHDGPEGYDRDGQPLRVRVSAFDVGDDEVQRVRDDAPIEFTQRSALRHRVWLESLREARVTGVAIVEAVAGETVEVDLRAMAQREGLGGLRVVVVADPDLVRSVGDDFAVMLSRPAPEGSRSPWEWIADDILVPAENERGNRVFETAGLEPGLHRVLVTPFGAAVEVDVVAGETRTVEVRLDQVGSVLLQFPPEYGDAATSASLLPADRTVGALVWAQIDTDELARDRPQPVVAGTYVATVNAWGQDALPGLESDPFVVNAGSTTVVPLRPKRETTVDVVVVHADTGAALSFDIDFWIGIAFVAEETGERVRGRVGFTGGVGAPTGTRHTFGAYDGEVRVEVPESAFWTFEAVEPLVLLDGTTITLKALPKGG